MRNKSRKSRERIAVKVEQTTGLPVLNVDINNALAAQYGLSVKSIQDVVAASVGGQNVGPILQGDRRFDFEIRLPDEQRTAQNLAQLPIQLPNGGFDPVARYCQGGKPFQVWNQVGRENGKRRVIVTANVEGRDLGSFVQGVTSNP